MSNIEKADEIGLIAKSIIAPIYMEEISKTYLMATVRDKGRIRSSRNLLVSTYEYDTARTLNVLPLHKINTF